MQEVTTADRTDYKRLKQSVTDNWIATLECMRGVHEIRERKLYRVEFETWDEFCDKTLGFTRQHVNRLISAAVLPELAKVKTEPIGSNFQAESVPITNEAQARELARVPEEKRVEVLEKAASEGPVTAASIAKAAGQVVPTPRAQPIIELDGTGFAIPEKCFDIWSRSGEVRKLLTAVSLLRSTLRQAQEQDDLLWRPVASKATATTWTSLINSLDKAYAAIGLALPYAVCPTCQGHLRADCATCQQRGFVSEFYYKNALDSDARRVRESACQKRKDK